MKNFIILLLVFLIGIFVGKSIANVVTSPDISIEVVNRNIPGETLLSDVRTISSWNKNAVGRIYHSDKPFNCTSGGYLSRTPYDNDS